MKLSSQKKLFVSVIIPCRNEEKYIEACLKSLVEEQTYPKEKIEILVVDGMSEDGTREKAEECREKYRDVEIKFLNNGKKFTPYAMNIGIKEAKGDIIVKADAHTQYQENFITLLVKYFNEKYEDKEVDVVGGQIVVPSIEDIKTIEKDESKQIKIRAIALCLTHRFGSASSFRLGTKEPRFVDTVFGVGYRKEMLEKIKEKDGKYFNENLWRSQDFELNLRVVRKGGNILLVPDIQFKYYPKSNFKEFFQHNFLDGIWAIYPLKFTISFKLRHYLPLLFISGLIGLGLLSFFDPFFFSIFIFVLSFYLLLSIFFSFEIAIKQKDLNYLFLMPIVFGTRHFGYGLGSLLGLIKLFGK